MTAISPRPATPAPASPANRHITPQAAQRQWGKEQSVEMPAPAKSPQDPGAVRAPQTPVPAKPPVGAGDAADGAAAAQPQGPTVLDNVNATNWKPISGFGGNLEKFGYDLTAAAARGELRPAIGRTRELEQLMEVLGRPVNNNPVILGESGVGKTALVEELARRIVSGEVPEHLKNRRMVAIDLNAMTAGTTLRGQFEERLQGVVREVEASKGGIIPFIDEVHLLTSAGAAQNTEGAAQAIKPVLARGKLRLVGATTTKEYDEKIRPDAALHRRFSNIMVNEPGPDLTVKMLQGTAPWLEGNSGLKFTNDALKAVQEMSSRYVVDRFQPAKAIEVASQTVGRMQMLKQAPPREVNDMRDQVTFLTNEFNVLSRETSPESKQKAAEVAKKLETTKAELNTTLSMWEQASRIARGERPDAGTDVDKIKARFPEMFRNEILRDDVAKSISERTGVPVGSIQGGERDKLLKLEENLMKKVIGQDTAISSVARAIRRGRTGVADPGKPVANILMLGPPGVGKTETAKATAAVMFDNVEALQRFNMGEYGVEGSRERLVNDVSDAMRRRPFSVVLFDEIEKAHPQVYDSMMTALGEGKLKDSHGRTADLSNAVVLLASNMKREDLPNFFRPEFIDRMDDIVDYSTLSKDSLAKIADIQIGQLESRVGEGVKLKVTPDARSILVDKGYAPDSGARNLKRVIERTIGDAIADSRLAGKLKANMTFEVSAKDGQLVFTPVAPEAPPAPPAS